MQAKARDGKQWKVRGSESQGRRVCAHSLLILRARRKLGFRAGVAAVPWTAEQLSEVPHRRRQRRVGMCTCTTRRRRGVRPESESPGQVRPRFPFDRFGASPLRRRERCESGHFDEIAARRAAAEAAR